MTQLINGVQFLNIKVLPAIHVIVPLTSMYESLKSHNLDHKILFVNAIVYSIVSLFNCTFIHFDLLSCHKLEVKSTFFFNEFGIFW